MKHRPYLSTTSALISSTDWSRTSLGDPDGWPVSLRGYVSMVMAMPTPAIIFWGKDLTQIYNDGYAQIMGPRHPKFFGSPYRECWPDTYPLIYPWMRRVLDDAEVVEVDSELIPVTRFGFEEDAYFTFTFSPLRDDEGRIAGILQPVFDVTETVLAERRARVLRSMSALQGRGDALWQAAMQTLAAATDDIPRASIWHEGASGGTPSCAASISEPADPNTQANAQRLAREALEANVTAWGDHPRMVALPLGAGPPGGPRAVLVAQTSTRLHENRAYVEFLEMVGVELASAVQRAQSAIAAEAQRAFLRRLFLQAPAGIAVLRGPQHVFELTNPLYQALIGHRQVIGLPLREAMPELQGQPFLEILDRVLRTGEAYVGLSEPAQLERTPGAPRELVFFNFVYQPLAAEDAGAEGILVFCYEVTEQVLARQHAERLAEALRQEHSRKDEFLAMLAHELRNPLAPVRSASELLLLAPGREDVVHRASTIIARQVQHMSALVNDLLDVSRVTRGIVELDRQPQHLQAVIQEAVEQMRPLIDSKSHKLFVDMPDERVEVAADHKRLVQVFANLLNNAAKYTSEGGELVVRLEVHGGYARVIVQDNGIGIEPELLPCVFDLFVQGQRGAARAEGGLGIGLALVRRLAQLHGGNVSATSAGEGHGSRFEVMLPVTTSRGDAEQQPRAVATAVRGTGRLLVVDDNVDAAQMLALQLQELGYDVHLAYTGRAAVEACTRQRFLSCLVDIGLPDIAGTEVAVRLKSVLQDDAPMLVGVSGYGQDSDVHLALDAGFDHYFVKPVDVVPLSHLLHNLARRCDDLNRAWPIRGRRA